MAEDSENTWLESKIISCPDCKTKSYAVERSPFYNSWHLYCEKCPKSVEISYYDPQIKKLRSEITENDSEALFDLIEQCLLKCDCGGKFKFNSPRRCFHCQIILTDKSNIDISIYTGCEVPPREATEAEQELFDEFEKKFVRRDELWK